MTFGKQKMVSIPKSHIVACLMLLLMPIVNWAQGNDVKATNSAEAMMDLLVTKLTSREIARVEVLQIPSRLLTRTRITPEMLEKQFHFKVTIRDVRGEVHQQTLTEAMKSTSVQPETDIADLRWGIIFYGLDDKRVGAVYFDKTGSRGNVENDPVSFRGGIFKWLNDNFSDCLR
jgi:hypothetical protein